jgi:hypothetical protein
MLVHPELYCLFERDNGILRPLISREKLEAIFDGIIFILLLTLIFSLTSNLTHLFWNTITEYIDAQNIIVMCALSGFLAAIIFND